MTDSLKSDLEMVQATGCQFDVVEIKTSEQFEDFHADNLIRGLSDGESLPVFHWLKPTGVLLQDDFAQTGIENGFQLCVSQRVWDIMKKHNMTDCLIEEM